MRSLLPDKTTSLIVLATLVGVVPRLLVAIMQYIEYDGWWHIFIARQDVWSNFVWEYNANAHPPLFFLLLKVGMLLGKSRLTYRLVSLVAGIATAFVLGRLVGRWSRHWAVPAIVTLAFSLSWSAIVVSCEVRSYALCVLFLAVGGYSFFELNQPRLCSVARHSLGFCVASALALLTHYSAALFLLAAAAVLAGRLALVRSFRLRVVVVLRRMPSRILVPVVVPLATAAFLYFTHARPHVTALNHLPEYYLASSGAGGPFRFLLKNTALLVGLFLPFRLDVASLRAEAVVTVVSLMVVIGVLALPLRRGSRAPHRLAGALVLVMIGIAMVLGLASAYPYGGALRHQFYLFPFLLLFLAAGLDRLLCWVGSRGARTGILLFVFLGLTSGFVAGSKSRFTFRDEFVTKQVLNLWRVFPEPPAVYVDQFSLVALFSAYHEWTWQFIRTCPANSGIQQYTLTRRDKQMTVFRDRSRWELDPRAESSGKDLRGCLDCVAPRPVVVFALRQSPGKDEQDWLISSGGLARAGASLANGGVRVRKAAVSPSAGFVELCLGSAPERDPQ